MKWTNPSHEFDDKYVRYSGYLKGRDGFCVFGAGQLGKKYVKLLEETKWKISYVIDNDPEKWGHTINDGLSIISLDEYIKNHRNCYLIIALSEKYYPEVKMQLQARGLIEGTDYCKAGTFFEDIIPLLYLYDDGMLWLDVVELSLTERCTLKCKKCAHGCCYVPGTKPDLSVSEVKNSIDNLFRLTDKINDCYLIGGEPLLYNHLAEVITYAGEKYRDRMGRFIITTNGTIMPGKDVLTAAARYEIIFFISNYSITIPQLNKKYTELCKLFKEHNVNYELSSIERTWYDYGFDYVDHGFDEKKLVDNHDTCFTRCREIRGDRFYYCIQARSVAENTGRTVSDDDYLDISSLEGLSGKRTLYEYSKGYCSKGYIDMCNYCNGSESLKHPIPVAEQLKD